MCRRWRDVGEAPHLWTNTCVRVDKKAGRPLDSLPDILTDSRRLKMVRAAIFNQSSSTSSPSSIVHMFTIVITKTVNITKMTLTVLITQVRRIAVWSIVMEFQDTSALVSGLRTLIHRESGHCALRFH